MNSPEEAILNTESGSAVARPLRPTPDIEGSILADIAPVVRASIGLGPRCTRYDHDKNSCSFCATQAYVEARAALEATEKSIAVAPVAQPAPIAVAASAKVETIPVLEPKGDLVLLAEQHEAARRQLQRDEQLLVAAEARVEMLKESIAKSKSTAEAARMTLADHLEKLKQEAV